MFAVVWWLGACAPKVEVAPAATAEEPVDDDAAAGVKAPALRKLISEQWNGRMERYPEWATSLGDHRFDERIFDPSEGARRAWLAREQEWATRLSLLPDAMLSDDDRVTRDLLLGSLRADLATSVCRLHEWSLSARTHALVDVNQLAEDTVVDRPAAGRALVARYRALPASIDLQIENLRAGLRAGRVANADSLRLVVQMLDDELAAPVDGVPMLAPIGRAATADGWTDDERTAFATDLRAAVNDGIRPALGRYRDVIRDELLPQARTGDRIGMVGLPDGLGCYEALIRESTTLHRTADEIHAIGLDALAKVHAEFRALGADALGTSDLPTIFARLRADPALHFETAAQVQTKAEEALRRAEREVPKWFGRLPLAPCVVEPIPDYLAPYTYVAYYQQARPDGTKPGVYFINTSAPETRPRFEAEVLAFHESVPGHHFQIAIAQELGELPAFRRYDGATAYVEGWALYVERLADEMGLYTSEVDRLGMLSFDAWRASRLVVDTGIHAKGWTRDQAVQFMLDNTPLAENNVRNEVDRYVTWPGQALAYKIGQLEILALRAEAERALGDRFDIREYHEVVLGGGAVTLPILRERIEGWIQRTGALPEG